MRVEVVVMDPSTENYGVEVSADGVNPVQLVLRAQRTFIALLSPEQARDLAEALHLAVRAKKDAR